MQNEIIDIVGRLIAAVFVGIIAYLTPKIKAWIDVHVTESSQQTIKTRIKSFAKAAEQLLHDDDPTGEKRMKYVKNQLDNIGIKVTEEIISMIEGQVWEINNQNRKNEH